METGVEGGLGMGGGVKGIGQRLELCWYKSFRFGGLM